MKIDAQLYRRALEEYRQWNEAELKARVQDAANRDPDVGWQEFNDLWVFARAMGVEQSLIQRQHKLEALQLYYERLKRLEAWRQTRGYKVSERSSTGHPFS